MENLLTSQIPQISSEQERNDTQVNLNDQSSPQATKDGQKKDPAQEQAFKYVEQNAQTSIVRDSQACAIQRVLYSDIEIRQYREAFIDKLLEWMNKFSIECCTTQEIAITILSQVIPYTQQIHQLKQFIIAFAISQACYPTYNDLPPSKHISLLNEGNTTYQNCIGIYMNMLTDITLNSDISLLKTYDSIHSHLKSLLANDYVQYQTNRYTGFTLSDLMFRLNPQNSTFAHLAKILSKIKLSKEEHEMISVFLQIYWTNEELFYYPPEMCAIVIFKLMQAMDCIESDISSFNEMIDHFLSLQTTKWISAYHQLYKAFYENSQIEDLFPMEIELEDQFSSYNQYIQFANHFEMSSQLDSQRILSDQPFQCKPLQNLNIDCIQIKNSNSSSNKNISNLKQDNSISFEMNYSTIISGVQNHEFIETKTPEKKICSSKNKNYSLFSDSQERKQSSLELTQETKSSSISNFSISSDKNNSSNLKDQKIKLSPAPFNHQPLSFSNSQYGEFNY